MLPQQYRFGGRSKRAPFVFAATGAVPKMLAELDVATKPVQMQQLSYRVVGLVDPTPQIRIVRLAATAGALRFAAGQYAMLAFGEHHSRPFSMAGRPDNAILEFHMRHGLGEHAVTRLRPGDGVGVEGPFGHAFLREQHSGPILGVAGGTGMAPLLSIVTTVLARDPGRDVTLYVGARDEPDLYLAARLTQLAQRHPRFRWIPVLSESVAPTGRRTGLVTDALAEDLAAGDVLQLAGSKAYFAGPRPMVATAAAPLRAAGLADDDMHGDGIVRER